MNLKHHLRSAARKAGYDVIPFTSKWSAAARRRSLFIGFGIDVVLDVGANTGQYGHELRHDLRFGGRICSFEPMSDAYGRLEARATGDPMWTTYQLALGDVVGRATINLAANSESSSILEMLPSHSDAAPEAQFVGTEEIQVETLDAIFDDVARPGERVYLKIDTQGFEGRVLRGADRSLATIDTIQVEMALTPLYDGEMAFRDLLDLLLGRGYEMVGLEPGFSDPRTGRLLQVDGIFHREGGGVPHAPIGRATSPAERSRR